jgi:hypothetical protein
MANDIFTRAKEYRKAHPRTSGQDAIQKVKGKKVSGAKKPVKRAIAAKPAKPAKAKKAAPRKVINVRVGKVAKAAPRVTPLARAQKIINTIDKLEAKRSAQPNKYMKDVVQLVINAEHKKLDSLMRTLKKQA